RPRFSTGSGSGSLTSGCAPAAPAAAIASTPASDERLRTASTSSRTFEPERLYKNPWGPSICETLRRDTTASAHLGSLVARGCGHLAAAPADARAARGRRRMVVAKRLAALVAAR